MLMFLCLFPGSFVGYNFQFDVCVFLQPVKGAVSVVAALLCVQLR